MYRHILIPTDGSELAEHAVTNGLSLAKSMGAKASVIVVEKPFDVFSVPESRAMHITEMSAKHAEQIKKHATSVLNRAAEAAKQAGVSCDTIQVEHEQPYQAIIAAAHCRRAPKQARTAASWRGRKGMFREHNKKLSSRSASLAAVLIRIMAGYVIL
ncbi:MAG: universal stress protein [Xanthobacteraceae bacterium]|nr:universal stress protein [Xanthobacteraceae bacterium]